MYAFSVFVAAFIAFVGAVSAEDIYITVGQNTTNNASAVFIPQRVTAKIGDTVFFNFTQGNHTATQSTFAAPCIPAHDSNITINGFNSGFRDAGNGTAVTILSVPMLPENVNQTMWFYDFNTCGQGGVGVINNNESSTETLDGFVRNAIRLNGTDADNNSSTTSGASTGTAPAPSSTQTGTSDARRVIALSGAAIIPLLVALSL